MSYEYVLDTTDPEGRRVVLRRNTWKTHILPRHPEMKGRLPEIKSTVEKPDDTLPIEKSTTRWLYFKEVNSVSKYVYVYVERSERPSVIVTAHFARKRP